MGDNLPSNSRSRKVPPPQTEKKRVTRVTEGEVVRRKKPWHRRASEVFVGGDARGVWGYVMLDVLIPAAKDMISDAFSQGMERMLFGEARPRSRRDSRGGTHVPYNRYSSSRREEPRRGDPPPPSRGRAFDEIILPSRAEAEEVLDQLFAVIDQYDSVTVGDLYGMCNLPGSFTDEKWGWYDLRSARVSRVRNGYLLDLPKPEPLD